MKNEGVANGYDECYRTPNYFRDRRWLYRSFVKALIAKAKLRPGACLLDAGCGQGFFTSLFAENGLKTLGVDISPVGIAAATQAYGSTRATFMAGDLLKLGMKNKFDCIFTRSCSLYNATSFEEARDVTDMFLSYLREDGILIFDYYSRLKPTCRSEGWIYHSIRSVQRHFSPYQGVDVYFSLRLEALLLGKFALTRGVSSVSAWLSSLTGAGGEIVAFVRKNAVSDGTA
jgi:SAM-dependent methyltransferase